VSSPLLQKRKTEAEPSDQACPRPHSKLKTTRMENRGGNSSEMLFS
jgi:hypothetical protein